MKTCKKVLAVLLAVFMLACSCAVFAAADNVIPTDPNDPRAPTGEPQTYEVVDGLFVGNYEAGNCRWTFDPATGEMIFYATGENATVPPGWGEFDIHAPYDFLYDVQSIYIDEGIKHIGFGAFLYMIGVRTITLPSTLEDEFNIIFFTLDSLETVVVKSSAFAGIPVHSRVTGGDTFMFPLLEMGQPITDVNYKRALMEVRCELMNTVSGYRPAFELSDDISPLQELIDAANAKYNVHLPNVTEENVQDYIESPDLIFRGHHHDAEGDEAHEDCFFGNQFQIPPYFRLICAPDSVSAQRWELLKNNLYEEFQNVKEVEQERFANADPGSDVYELFVQELALIDAMGDIREHFEGKQTDISTYTETKPASYNEALSYQKPEQPANQTDNSDAPSASDNSDENVCKWCGKPHEGFWGKIVGFFHRILYFFAHLFGAR